MGGEETLREKSTNCNGGRTYLDSNLIQSTALEMYELGLESTGYLTILKLLHFFFKDDNGIVVCGVLKFFCKNLFEPN